MKYCRIFFYGKQLGHLYAAWFTYTVQVIPLQIHDHKKFALVFFRILQFCPHQKIFL